MKVTLGGNRLGSGEKMKVELSEYGRSSHDLSNAWRSTMSPGTLVPFMVHQTLPGDSWEIELNAMVLTPPANGGGMEIQQMMQMMLQNKMTEAQIENIKADTKGKPQ